MIDRLSSFAECDGTVSGWRRAAEFSSHRIPGNGEERDVLLIFDLCARSRPLLAQQSRSFLAYEFGGRGFGGRRASMMSPRQLKEVIQVAYRNVGSVASLGAPVGGEVYR
jgi:hypothetical protein